EAAVGGAAVDFVHRVFGVLHRDDDGGTQPGVPVQPLPCHPVIQCPGHGDAEVLAELGLDAVEAVADGEARAERVQRLPAQGGDVRSGAASLVAEVVAEAERIAGGVGDRGQVLDATAHDGFAPVVVEIRHQGGNAGNGRLDVAIDGGGAG